MVISLDFAGQKEILQICLSKGWCINNKNL